MRSGFAVVSGGARSREGVGSGSSGVGDEEMIGWWTGGESVMVLRREREGGMK